MIDAIFLGAASALWLGVLTSISPCPLATNVAAVSFIGKQFSSAPRVALSGLFYVLGRMLAYLLLGTLLVAGLLAAPQLSAFLQKSMNKLLGPILILVGGCSWTSSGSAWPVRVRARTCRNAPGGMGHWGRASSGFCSPSRSARYPRPCFSEA